MKRRDAIVGIALLGLPAGGRAQQRKVARVGVLRPGSSKESPSVQREPFERGLRELGWAPGSDVVILYRYAEGDPARLPQLASELVKERVDVLVATSVAIQEVRRANPDVPLVMAASIDPVAEGLADGLARPGRNATGIVIQTYEMEAKRLEILKEVFPQVRRVALIANPSVELGYGRRIDELRSAAARLKVELQTFEVMSREELTAALAAIERGRFDALMVRPEPRVMDPARHEIVATAARLKLPAVYAFRLYAESGGLMSYGESIPAFHHRAATYVSRILKGAKPGELAFERPTQFELIVNLKTARATGLQIPKSIVFRANHVIE